MERDIYTALHQWKVAGRRKPLLLQGARQTGKTYILKAFGAGDFERFMYCNFEEDPLLDQFFQRDLDPRRILSELAIYKKQEIRPGRDLLIFDEIQISNRALNSLKYFEEEKHEIHLAAAGSLLGVKMSAPGSFPVGKVNFLQLYPMTFMEFLNAAGESRYRKLLEEINAFQPVPEAFHQDIIRLLRQYYVVGGMPEAVKCFTQTGDIHETRSIQQEILKSYVLDFAKHAPTADIPKLTLIWESIPRHLARENKKFIFSAVHKGARAREYENALTWLCDAGLIFKVSAVGSERYPLAHYADTSCFKVYALDVGLLGALARSPAELMVQGNRLFNEYEGALVENYAAQEIVAGANRPLYYWRSQGGKAELDFLCEFAEQVCPLEVKAGVNPRSKSLKSYDEQFSPVCLVRTNLLNFKKEGKLCNIPLYAVSQLSRLFQKEVTGK